MTYGKRTLIAKGEAAYLELKCPRCGAYTVLRAASANPAGQRASYDKAHRAPQIIPSPRP
ncbi:Com family DNA-binding transcriptional regulator [uncultured Bilophila sp.]|uniref:Com family DNA-binding transcriptional regulator n=1 Tax=uncultured Bilophila sp. TaxID=529385 RepID=UPI00280A7F63|nr:Com family DNA-binding transcriptional regulator [uncultured Bilophila sp.]